MEILKLLNRKSLALFLLMGLSVFHIPANLQAIHLADFTNKSITRPADSIVMADTVLEVRTSAPSLIKQVRVLTFQGTTVEIFTHCNHNYCQFDLAHLAVGNYLVIVDTNTGRRFSGAINR